MSILDQHGKPIHSATLSEPQTARMAQLHHEFATHPSRGLTPQKLARIMEEAEQGDILAQHDLFLDMEEKDAHLYAEMSKRKRAILTVPWNIEPPRNASAAEKAQAEALEELLRDIPNLEDVLLDMMDGIGHGFAALEIEWAKSGKEWLPRSISHRPQSWFRLDRETRTELRLRDLSMDGAPLQPFGWIAHIHRAKSGYIARSGLHRILAWPYLYKNYSVRDLAEFLEIYGLPLRLGKYPPGSSDKEKATLLSAVVGIGHNAAGIIPEGMAIEIMEAAKGSDAPFIAMMQWAESSISKAVLGGTLTSQADGKTSTNALGNVHNEVRHDILESDARQIAATLNETLIHYLVALNFGGVADPRRMPRWAFDTGLAEDFSAYAEALPKLSALMEIPASWVREKLRIPEPVDGEDVLGAKQEAPPEIKPLTNEPPDNSPVPGGVKNPPEPDPAAMRASLSALSVQNPEDPIAARLEQDANPEMNAWLETLQAMLESADSLEEFRARLLAAYPNIDRKGMVAAMQAAFATAHLSGMAEVAAGDQTAAAQGVPPIHVHVSVDPARPVSKRIVRDDKGGWTVIETPEGE